MNPNSTSQNTHNPQSTFSQLKSTPLEKRWRFERSSNNKFEALPELVEAKLIEFVKLACDDNFQSNTVFQCLHNGVVWKVRFRTLFLTLGDDRQKLLSSQSSNSNPLINSSKSKVDNKPRSSNSHHSPQASFSSSSTNDPSSSNYDPFDLHNMLTSKDELCRVWIKEIGVLNFVDFALIPPPSSVDMIVNALKKRARISKNNSFRHNNPAKEQGEPGSKFDQIEQGFISAHTSKKYKDLAELLFTYECFPKQLFEHLNSPSSSSSSSSLITSGNRGMTYPPPHLIKFKNPFAEASVIGHYQKLLESIQQIPYLPSNLSHLTTNINQRHSLLSIDGNILLKSEATPFNPYHWVMRLYNNSDTDSYSFIIPEASLKDERFVSIRAYSEAHLPNGRLNPLIDQWHKTPFADDQDTLNVYNDYMRRMDNINNGGGDAHHSGGGQNDVRDNQKIPSQFEQCYLCKIPASTNNRETIIKRRDPWNRVIIPFWKKEFDPNYHIVRTGIIRPKETIIIHITAMLRCSKVTSMIQTIRIKNANLDNKATWVIPICIHITASSNLFYMTNIPDHVISKWPTEWSIESLLKSDEKLGNLKESNTRVQTASVLGFPCVLKIPAKRDQHENILSYKKTEFIRELSSLVMIPSHSRIIKLVGKIEKECTLVFPHYQLQDLHHFILKGLPTWNVHHPKQNLSHEWKLKFALELAKAGSHIHRSGFAYRDFKPANILVMFETQTRKGGIRKNYILPVLTDFGTCSNQQKFFKDITGSDAYKSPEQKQGLTYTTASDIYAYGMSLICLLTLNPSVKISQEQWSDAKVKDPSLCYIVEQCIKELHLRPQTFEDVIKLFPNDL